MPRLSPNNILPAAITNLRLCTALQNCGAIGVANAFDKSSAENLYVYDDGNLGYTDWTDVIPEFVSKCFFAANPNKNTIALLPLDGRIITGPSVIAGGVCDGMLLTDKEMCFIEFKTNVTSSNYQTILLLKGQMTQSINYGTHLMVLSSQNVRHNQLLDSP